MWSTARFHRLSSSSTGLTRPVPKQVEGGRHGDSRGGSPPRSGRVCLMAGSPDRSRCGLWYAIGQVGCWLPLRRACRAPISPLRTSWGSARQSNLAVRLAAWKAARPSGWRGRPPSSPCACVMVTARRIEVADTTSYTLRRRGDGGPAMDHRWPLRIWDRRPLHQRRRGDYWFPCALLPPLTAVASAASAGRAGGGSFDRVWGHVFCSARVVAL